MTYQEALHYIHSNFWQGSKPGLSRTQTLLGMLGDPQKKLKFIHVAGTNGKGSFCSMLSSVLIRAGYRVGTYTSPYILRFNERMKVGGKDIPDETLARLTEKIRPLADSMEDKPTEFELITAIAMEYFCEEKCDVVVLECGMGGRLDSTNAVENVLLSVITGIALDHTAFLGDTEEAIAAEKAGIIKKAIPVLYCGKPGEAERVIKQKAAEMNAPFHTVDRTKLWVKKQELSGTVLDAENRKDVFLPLLGSYQPENCQNVLKAVDLLEKLGLWVSEDAIKEGLKEVRWPARYEILRKNPTVLFDGGHNPEGVDGAIRSTKAYFGEEKLLILTGVMADKDYPYMVSRMAEVAKEAYCITPSNPRALKAEDLAEVFCKNGVPSFAFDTPKAALTAAIKKAKDQRLSILCLGSLYMYCEIYEAMNEIG